MGLPLKTFNGTPLNWVSWLYDSKHNTWVCEWTHSRCQIELFRIKPYMRRNLSEIVLQKCCYEKSCEIHGKTPVLECLFE